MSKEYTLITCCNRIPQEPYYCLNEFFKSLNEEKIVVLTEEFGGKWGGLASKPKWLYKAITSGNIKTEYMIFVDCWDLVFAVSPKEMFERYLLWYPSSPIVISAEKNCFPDDLKNEYDEFAKNSFTTSPYKYLNSGMIIGRTEDIFKCLEVMDLPNLPNDHFNGVKNIHPNDQFEWQKIFLKQPVKMMLDYDQKLCNTLHQVDIDALTFEPQGIFNKEVGYSPCAFHFNGGSKTGGLREPILKHLNLI